jgi:hemolysin activation/secretion protein
VEKGTDISLPGLLGDRELGPVAAADPADQLGARLRLQRTLGEDPTRPRLHGSTRLEGWAGTFDYGRAAADVQLAVPLGGGTAAALEVAGGSAFGEVPVQGLWRLGGARTLRGHPGSALAGERYWRARGEVGRGMQAVRLVAFGDVGWAGDAGDEEVTVRPLWAAGVGGSVLDGLLRLDVARGFGETGGWRGYLYLDGAM